jgi:hypothetical protein
MLSSATLTATEAPSWLIRAATGSAAEPGDVRDGNGDGRITVADVRFCQLRLTVR